MVLGYAVLLGGMDATARVHRGSRRGGRVAGGCALPIVFTSGVDPVKLGLVASLNRPGGNVTGVTFLALTLDAKRLELLHEMVPNVTNLGVLLNPNFPDAKEQLREVQHAAETTRLQIHILNASNIQEIDSAFDTFAQIRPGALLVGTDPFFVSRRERIVAFAARSGLPAIYGERDFTAAGGLISYGASFSDAVRQVGIYTGRILKGEKPELAKDYERIAVRKHERKEKRKNES
jgi:putative tryptophan/tyrosine transport system substrate-binding protein